MFLLKLSKKCVSFCLFSLLSNCVPALRFINFPGILICTCDQSYLIEYCKANFEI